MLIDDDECDTEYPEVLEDERVLGEEPLNPMPPTLLLATVHVARLMAPLAKLFRSLCITNETLAKFESHLGECMQLYPRPLQLTSSAALDPCIIAPLLYFQNTRLLLHRHNLSPSCSPEQRCQAIEQCLHAARDTANILSRCMIPHAQSHEWEQRFILSSTTLICTHLWRCMLFLIFRQLHDAFFLVLRAAATIDASRAVNMCCGRHLSFFLRRLIERFEQRPTIDLDQDEELLVYLSGDLQGSTNSWVWGNTETGTHLSRRQKHGRPKHAASLQEHEAHPSGSGPQSPSWDSMLSEEEQHDWGGWQQIERSAQYLQQLQEKQRHQPPLPHNHQPQPGGEFPSRPPIPYALSVPPQQPQHPQPGPTLAPISPQTPSRPPGPETNRSRMTIASII